MQINVFQKTTCKKPLKQSLVGEKKITGNSYV